MKNKNQIITEAILLRQQGYTYPQIENEIALKGLFDDNGKRVHNAAISHMVVNSPQGANFRQRTKGKKVKSTKKTKRAYTKSVKSSKVLVNSAFVSALRGQGISDTVILNALLKTK